MGVFNPEMLIIIKIDMRITCVFCQGIDIRRLWVYMCECHAIKEVHVTKCGEDDTARCRATNRLRTIIYHAV